MAEKTFPVTNLEALRQHRTEILEIAGHYGVENVRVFGSIVRSEQTATSDVDFLVDLTREWSLFDRIDFLHALEDLLGCKVDIAIAGHLKDIIRDHALAEAVPL